MVFTRNTFQRLCEMIERRLPMFNAPGIAIGIADRERTLHTEVFGLSDRQRVEALTPETLFQIGSISKSFTGIALLQLQEEGLLNIDDPVKKHLPWFEIQSEYAPITLRHLMSHSAGIVTGSDATLSSHTEAWALRHTKTSVAPGEVFHYSNSGYKVLGLVLESILQMDIADILRERLFVPLGMAGSLPDIRTENRHRLATGHEPYFNDRPLPPGGKLTPATWFESNTADGAICSNAEDMCLYLQSLLKRGEKILSPQNFNELIQPIITTGDGLHGEAYGLGLFTQQVDGHQVIGHSGGMVGYTADMLADLDAGLGVIVLTNGPANPAKISRYALALFRAVQEGRELPDFPADKIENIDDYLGTYRSSEKSFELREDEKRLALDFGADTVFLTSLATDLFLVPHPAFERFALRMGREKGQVTEAGWGGERFVRVGVGEDAEWQHPAEWAAYPGYYTSHNPWLPNFRILFYKDQLFLFNSAGDAEALHPLETGFFRIGDDPRLPEFIHFDMVIDGKAMQVSYSGGLYSRSFVA